MAYIPPTISGYNSSPPPDNGATTTDNKVLWSTIKSKLADPIKNYVDSINSAVSTAFGQQFLSDVSDQASTFTVGTTDDGKLYNCTSALTINLPPAADAGEGFKIGVFSSVNATITIDGNSSETINGATTFVLTKQYDSIILVCTGTGWFALKMNGISFVSQNIASGGTTDLGTSTSNNVLITGTTTITSFGSSASLQSPIYFVRFSGALTLTHNATSLIIPGAANITTAAGDAGIVEYLGSGNWRVISYVKASGLPIINTPAASQAEQEAASSNTVLVTPQNQHFHPSASKCWGLVTVSGGTPTLTTGYNVTSITDVDVGRLTVTINNDFSSANYAVLATVERESTGAAGADTRLVNLRNSTRAAGSFTLDCYSADSFTYRDPSSWSFDCKGDI